MGVLTKPIIIFENAKEEVVRVTAIFEYIWLEISPASMFPAHPSLQD